MEELKALKERTFRTLLPVWGLLALFGFAGVLIRFMTGEKLTGYGSYIPWGLWVALYFHGIGIGGGLFTVGALGYLLGIRTFRARIVEVILLSFIAMACGLFAIWVDLGHPFRMWKVFLQPSFSSMLAFNSWTYVLFFAVAGAVFVLSLRRNSEEDAGDRTGWLIPLLLFAGVLSIAFPSQSGAFFGVLSGKTFWASPLTPFIFFLSAIVSGSAVLLMVFTFLETDPGAISGQPFRFLRWIVIGGSLAYFAAEFTEIILGYWSPQEHHRAAFDLILFGPFWWVFWIVHLGGAIGFLFLLVRRESLPHLGWGGALAAVVFLSSRLNILIPGQAVPELRGLERAYRDVRLNFAYHASLNEYLVAAFIVSLGTALGYFFVSFASELKREFREEKDHGTKAIQIFQKAFFKTWRAAGERVRGALPKKV